ncbi:hypothetical protein PFISCL1PPCAC_18947 [Pristionchus fissidentatus]|uniref:Uncharacterized protein n=1 Tax=Pristionchus fissidentatus TaxID=1538716 RepID=A0AAV5W7C1_9BILA|nr:hypothetical protein PFISCL1PPCAC_18947 [Pristionchus fissidentatus]
MEDHSFKMIVTRPSGGIIHLQYLQSSAVNSSHFLDSDSPQKWTNHRRIYSTHQRLQLSKD